MKAKMRKAELGRPGRPHAITPKIAEAICERIASGRTLLDVARDEDLPHRDTIYGEVRRNPDFAQAIANARGQSAYGLADSVITIADDPELADKAQWVRNRCDQRRWLAGRFNPMFADKVAIATETPLDTMRAKIMAMTREERQAWMRSIEERMRKYGGPPVIDNEQSAARALGGTGARSSTKTSVSLSRSRR